VTDTPSGNRPRLIGVIVIGLIALIALAVLASLSLDDGSEEQIQISGAQEVQGLVGGIPQLEDRLGQDDAPVTIEVFSDTQCDECAGYQIDVIDQLIEDEVRDGDVKLIFRHYSMDPDRATGVGGFGAESAGLQDQQWQFVELFFRNTDLLDEGEVISQPFLDQIANGILNLNVEQWQRDFNDERIREELEEDEMAAVQRRLPLQPAVVVTGPTQSIELIESPSLERIREAIAQSAS
jgi:protein-disulfide isomerase